MGRLPRSRPLARPPRSGRDWRTVERVHDTNPPKGGSGNGDAMDVEHTFSRRKSTDLAAPNRSTEPIWSYQDPRGVPGSEDAAGRLEPVELGHTDIDEDAGRMEVCRLGDSLQPLAHLGDALDVVLSGEQPALPCRCGNRSWMRSTLAKLRRVCRELRLSFFGGEALDQEHRVHGLGSVGVSGQLTG